MAVPDYISEDFLHSFIAAALREDIGDGDHSTLSAIPETATKRARLLVKESGILAGVELAKRIFQYYDGKLTIETYLLDGAIVKKGDIAFSVSGSARSLLTTERLVLNCMQRMSGIATKTRRLVELVAGTHAKLLDTRKTTPNFRLPEKWAVVIGGGGNHRLGLYDMIMLKDNHNDMAGGIRQAINRAKDYLRAENRQLRIEVETRNLDEVRQVLDSGGVDVIMLDNMSVEQMKEALRLIDGRCKTEASGNITEENIASVAECGVDYISVGALTHSVRSLDLSLKAY
jgi:nicotinate-nucleotide pyrophosphorylase (carboxylating)